MTDETEIIPPKGDNETVPSADALFEKPPKPALTIHVYSWATPIIGVVMLVVGLLAGYFARPLIARSMPTPITMVQATSSPQITSSPQATRSTNTTSLKDVIVAQTRHFIGEENAPVVIVEFSDFQ